VLVQVAGKDLLAGARFAGEQHGGVGLGDLVGQGQQLAGVRVGGDHPLVLAGHRVAPHVLEQHLGLEGLHQEVAGAAAHGIDGLLDVAEGGHQQHRQLGQALAQFGQQLQAVHGLHLQVGEDQVEGLLSTSARAAGPSPPR
jgi:hypothetical protein